MATIKEFMLPDLGEGLEEGEIVAWHVDVGEVIELNQPVADIETAKAIVAVPTPFAGTVVERIGAVGDTLAVGSVFLRVDVASDEASDGNGPRHETGGTSGAAPRSASALDAQDEPQPLVGYGQGRGAATRRRRRRHGTLARDAQPDGIGRAAAGQPAPTGGSRPLAKPPVRKLAKELGVDLAGLAPGSGPGGTVTRDDVHLAAAAADATSTSAPAAGATVAGARSSVPGFRGRTPGEVEQVRGIRRRIMEKMERSRREIPSASCSRDADLTELWALRTVLSERAEAEGLDVRITPFVLILRATVLGLRRFPTLNARLDREAGEIHLLEDIHLGFAADTERGLVVPTIKDAHARSTFELAVELERLGEAARTGTIGPAELTGGTFTVNNYGAFGADDGDPVINHPEAAILGIGAIRERPWVLPSPDGGPGSVAVRMVGRFTLAFDHRVCDGGEAGRFVSHVAELCEHPAQMLLHA